MTPGTQSRSLAPALGLMPGSAIREIAGRAWTMPDAIHLELGEPDFATPDHIVAAAAEAAAAGETKYTPTAGIPALREALVHKLEQRNGIMAAADQVVVTAGAVQGLHAVFATLLGPGTELLIPDPGWPNFEMLAALTGTTPRRYPLRRDTGFRVQTEDLERLVSPRTRALLINTPSNPLGTVMDRAELEPILDFAGRHDLWVVSDEAYDELVFDGDGVSVATTTEDDRVVSIFTFSKTYAMTGWRVGYVVAPPEVARGLAKVQQAVVSCINAPVQFAALAALEGPQHIVGTMRSVYRTRRDHAVARLVDGPLSASVPDGAFYLWVDVSAGGVSSREIAARLLDEQQVAVVPGTGFGESGSDAVRVSLAADEDNIVTGLDRLREVVADSAESRVAGSGQER